MLNTIYPPVRGGPPQASRIIRPAGLTLPAGTERYNVSGAGAMLIDIAAGDSITVTNDEGGQICEIVVADASGRIDAGMVDHGPNSDAA
ncbi:aminomethyltransferase, partial [Mesorhizobium sp. M2D.F.Ca.ET.147.01.1.1]